MKTSVLVIISLVGIAIALPVSGQVEFAERFYVGGGLIYSISDIELSAEGETAETDNGFGLGVKGGYFLNDFLALEGLLRYHFNYSVDEEVQISAVEENYAWAADAKIDGDGAVLDFSVNAKGYLPLKGNFRPYGVAGLGYAFGKVDYDADTAGYWWYLNNPSNRFSYEEDWSDTESESDFFARLGIGGDFFFDRTFGLEGEFSYNFGFGDLDKLKFYDLYLGTIFLF